MSESETKLKGLLGDIKYFRYFTLFYNFFCFIQLILVVVFPDSLNHLFKIWLIVIAGSAFVGISLAIVLSKNDSRTSLIFTSFSLIIDSIIFGIALAVFFTHGG